MIGDNNDIKISGVRKKLVRAVIYEVKEDGKLNYNNYICTKKSIPLRIHANAIAILNETFFRKKGPVATFSLGYE